MTIKPSDMSQGDTGNSPCAPQSPVPSDQSRGGNKVFKSGPLFLSSKGIGPIGWVSWKKRWFILTRTSLVFFRSDPNAVPQKGSEVNLTLGGIDLNNTGSVVVKSDKKLLTVLFPDGRDGRAFTLKAESIEDLYEWKIALEEALKQAPSGTYVMGQNGVIRNDPEEAVDAKEKLPIKFLVVGRPVLLALEDVDGTPSFLEKALQFVEDRGVKTEGILRQAADVELVERRIREYEQGKIDFSADEDAHVIADCVKYIIRELPSSPVPASCCKALLEASRTDRSKRLVAVREAIYETFPEPNRKLLQRILSMMQAVAAHKDVNRMSTSAVAACMAPLLLRPLLAGDCELEHDFDLGGDGSMQLLQAAAAANHAQAIAVTLLEEYESIFGGGVVSTELYSDMDDSCSEGEELTDDDESYDDEDEEYETENSDVDEDYENASKTRKDIGDSGEGHHHTQKESNSLSMGSKSSESEVYHEVKQKTPSHSPKSSLDQHDHLQSSQNLSNQHSNSSLAHIKCDSLESGLVNQSPTAISNGPTPVSHRAAVLGRNPGRRNLSTESIELPSEDEAAVEMLEGAKVELEKKLAEEAKANVDLQAGLENRKNALLERRLVLEQDVARIKEQLRKERELREILEAGIRKGTLPASSSIDEKTRAEIEEIARLEKDVNKLNQTALDLREQLNQQQQQNSILSNSQEDPSHQSKPKGKGKNAGTKAALQSSRKFTRIEEGQMHNLDHDREKNNIINTKSHSMTSASFFPKKSSTGEGASPPASTLSKLTNRLNFLKERRNQIANEILGFDKFRNPDPFEQISGTNRGSKDKFKGLGIDVITEGHQINDTDVSKEQDGWSFPVVDTRKFDEQPSPSLERVKLDNSPTGEQGPRPDSHPMLPPTLSR